MPVTKKAHKPKNPSNTKIAKTKPVQKPKTKAKPAPKVAVKTLDVNVPVAEKKAPKTRGYTRKPKGSFADLLKIQSQYEEAKKGAKADLKKQYDSLIKEADSIKGQYKGLFNENIESAPKARAAGAKKTKGKIPGLKPFSIREVEEFVEQKKEGKTIKISGRRPKSIAKLEDAYRRSEDAEDILKMLNQ